MVRKKPYTLVVHTGTNDVQQAINNMKKIAKLAGEMKDIDSKNETEIMFSGLNQGNDQNFRNQIEKNNSKLKRRCQSKGCKVTEN